MTIKTFIETEQGKPFKEQLKGCNKNWHVEYWTSIEEYADCLKTNNWNIEEISEQINFIKNDGSIYWSGKAFCIVL